MRPLSPEKTRFLKEISAPLTVAVPPDDAMRDMCQMPDGTIRFFGKERLPGGEIMRCCIISQDYGLSWQKEWFSNPETLGAMTFIPDTQEFVTTAAHHEKLSFYPSMQDLPPGTYAVISPEGPGGTKKEYFKISDNLYLYARQPLLLKKRKRMIVSSQYRSDYGMVAPVVMYSDDNGRTWKESFPENLGVYPVEPPHRGMRWQQYSCEPTVAELSTGRLLLISRTTFGKHCLYTSDDGGESWSKPQLSDCFYSCNTMPLLKRMDDGRLLFFWCNTQPLPELDHEKDQWGLTASEAAGLWEDVFTNRDANHAALSCDDGLTWQGFREIALNAARNVSDFRSFASGLTLDKSVHQFEALELPFGKILLAFGQAPASRRLVIFDPDWLLEKKRSEDFHSGLINVSTQVFVDSISGSHRPAPGHCSWNRTHGALLVPDPARDFTEVLHIVTPDDPRLFNRTQGVVWNFPAMKKGELALKLKVSGEPLRISLTDRWFNPCDETVEFYAQISFTLDKEAAAADPWQEVKISFDLLEKRCTLSLGDNPAYSLSLKGEAPAGLSYLILQNTSQEPDFKGTLVKFLSAESR